MTHLQANPLSRPCLFSFPTDHPFMRHRMTRCRTHLCRLQPGERIQFYGRPLGPWTLVRLYLIFLIISGSITVLIFTAWTKFCFFTIFTGRKNIWLFAPSSVRCLECSRKIKSLFFLCVEGFVMTRGAFDSIYLIRFDLFMCLS